LSTSLATLGNFQAVPCAPAIYRPGVIGGFALYPRDYSLVLAENVSGSTFEVLTDTNMSVGGGCAVVGPPGGQWLYSYEPWHMPQ
jgi:hypothetical protein